MTRHLCTSTLLLASPFLSFVLPAASQSLAMSQSFASGESAMSVDSDYMKGTQALDQQRWKDAVSSFDRVIAAHSKKSDAALYWKAYALNKLGRTSLASATCNQLHVTYASSTWNKDCSALSVSSATTVTVSTQVTDNGIVRTAPRQGDEKFFVRGSTAHTGDQIYIGPMEPNGSGTTLYLRDSHSPEAGSDADLKMLALNSVLQRDPSRAIPVIRDVLNGNNSQELKHRALSVLGMSQTPEAQSLLRDVATGKVAPSEQRQAIQMLGVFQGKRAGDTLSEIYRTSNDRNIKRSAISSMFVAGDAPRMVDLARNEKDLQLKHDIVAQLALMKDKAATDYMLELLK